MMDEIEKIHSDLVQLSRLALTGSSDDVRLYVARLVRRYRGEFPETASKMEMQLRSKRPDESSFMRKTSTNTDDFVRPPVDDESRLSLLKTFEAGGQPAVEPLLQGEIKAALTRLTLEHKRAELLASLGLRPSRSAVFVGPPGVGKTMAARWLADQLGLPFYVLDLTAVMSSLLGKSGNNIRAALDYAKRAPCVLLLDEVDSIAKRRSDDADVGELKRLVTVILQEVDEWPSHGLLLAATNHPELVDPALWRRFDLVVEFTLPSTESLRLAVTRFLGPDQSVFDRWIDALVLFFEGLSFSGVEREIFRLRRAYALGLATVNDLVEEMLRFRVVGMTKNEKLELASKLGRNGVMSQHSISNITGVSRDTIRKYSVQKVVRSPAAKKELV